MELSEYITVFIWPDIHKNPNTMYQQQIPTSLFYCINVKRQQFLFIQMESLLASRKISEEPSRLEGLSPQKYGKAAFSALTYTPSKLADNILYKEYSNQKKLEEGSSKLRQTEASNSILNDRLDALHEEKEGIEKALGDQIAMYKKILKEKQEKNQKRIKHLQEGFNTEIGRVISQKQEEAKYAQAEKELLENRIAELEQQVAHLQHKLSNVGGDYENMVNENEKLKLIQDALNKRLEDADQAYKKLQERSKEQVQELRKKLQETELDWQRRLDKEVQTKNRELENMDRLHRNELQKIQNKRVQQALLKNQQLKDLAATFQKQTTRLNGIISKKQEQISHLANTIDQEKERAFTAAKGYENQISNLSHEKARLKEEFLKADVKAEKLLADKAELQDRMYHQASALKEEMAQLQKDLELNQINLMREVDKNDFNVDELSREVARLRIENDQVLPLMDENTILSRELRNMKELLIESSAEMQRCKQEFIRIGREKDMLAARLRELGIQNETLYRIKNEREQEARNWRESYFTQKTKF